MTRLRTTLRYKGCLRLGLLTYVILLYVLNRLLEGLLDEMGIHNFQIDSRFYFQVEFFGQKLALTGDPLCQWLENPNKINDHFIQYGNEMALLYDCVNGPGLFDGMSEVTQMPDQT
nr:hypothetical protein BaRGS_030549 [Batillaria attramentaria]